MQITCVTVGDLKTNCYILKLENHVLVIDPGAEYPKIKENIADNIVDGVLITHHHDDHVGALNYFSKDKIYDFSNLKEGTNEIGLFIFTMIKTPGHRSDAVSFYFAKEKALFVGDFIFYETIGRTDLDTGDMNIMQKSLAKTKCFADDVIIYPGHGPQTSFAHERKYNIYLRGNNGQD